MLGHQTVGDISSSLVCPKIFRVAVVHWFLHRLPHALVALSLVSPLSISTLVGCMMNLEARFAYRFNLRMACCEMRLGCLHSRMLCIWWHDVLGKPLEHVAYVLLNEA